MLVGVCSAKGSPGVTVSALAFTLTWPGPVLLAECDPAGGDLAAGFLREVALDGRGLGPLGASLRRGRLAEDVWGQLVDLTPEAGAGLSCLVLPGLSEPGQARAWSSLEGAGGSSGWQELAALFTSLGDDHTGVGHEAGSGYEAGGGAAGGAGVSGAGDGPGGNGGAGGSSWRGDVIADCGRLAAADYPGPVLAAADLVMVVARPVLGSIRAAAVGVVELSRQGIGPVGVLVVGDGDYAPAECARELGVPLVGVLPSDPGTAGVLSRGGRTHRGRLLRATGHVGAELARRPSPPAVASGSSGGQHRDRTGRWGAARAGLPGLGARVGRRRRGEASGVR